MEKTEDYRDANSLSSKPTAHNDGLITSVSKLYFQALKDNLSKHFDGNLPVLTTFKVFDPMHVFEKNVAGFKTYGVAEVGILTHHFHQGVQDNAVNKEELIYEWNKFKGGSRKDCKTQGW